MKFLARLALVISVFSAVLSMPAVVAQNTPGVALNVTAVPADIQTLFDLAEQAYPTLFGNTTGWRSHGGYTYQYYAAGGIYAGVKDGNVYLLGGPFGTSIVQKGVLSAAIGALQNTIAKQTASGGNSGGSTGGGSSGGALPDFEGLQTFNSVADLIARFKVISFESGSNSSLAKSTTAVKLEFVETGTVEGVIADHVTVTLSGGSLGSGTLAYTMWVDREGNILRLLTQDGFEYTPQTTAQAIGSGLVSSFLLSLKAANSLSLQAALEEERQNPSLSTKVSTKAIGKEVAQVITLSVTGADGSVLEWDVADFGSFSLITHYKSTSSIALFGTTYTDMIELELK